MPTQIGELLVKENLITTEQLDIALKQQRQNGGRLGSILINLGYVEDDDITSLLSRKYGVPSINLAFLKSIRPLSNLFRSMWLKSTW